MGVKQAVCLLKPQEFIGRVSRGISAGRVGVPRLRGFASNRRKALWTPRRNKNPCNSLHFAPVGLRSLTKFDVSLAGPHHQARVGFRFADKLDL